VCSKSVVTFLFDVATQLGCGGGQTPDEGSGTGLELDKHKS